MMPFKKFLLIIVLNFLIVNYVQKKQLLTSSHSLITTNLIIKNKKFKENIIQITSEINHLIVYYVLGIIAIIVCWEFYGFMNSMPFIQRQQR